MYTSIGIMISMLINLSEVVCNLAYLKIAGHRKIDLQVNVQKISDWSEFNPYLSNVPKTKGFLV